MRLRIAFVAAIASFSLALVAVPAAEAANGSATPPSASSIPALDTVHVTGVAKNHKKFNGTYGIQRFVVRHHKVYALGTLKGTLGGRHVTRYNVMAPASLTGGSSPIGAARAAQTAPSCSILHLVLGPINLNLLGLQVTLGGLNPTTGQPTEPIVLDITAVPGNGNLLGNLLCNLTNALNQGGLLSSLNNNLQQLTAALNGLTGLLGALGV